MVLYNSKQMNYLQVLSKTAFEEIQIGYNLTNDTELEHNYMFKWFHRRKDNHSKHLLEFKERLVMQELASLDIEAIKQFALKIGNLGKLMVYHIGKEWNVME